MSIKIVGAGFSGLSLAYLLARRGLQVEVFEAAGTPGGLIATKKLSSGLAESGAHSFLIDDLSRKFLDEVGAPWELPLPASKKRYLYRDRIRRWPLDLWESLGLGVRLLRLVVNKKKALPRPGQSIQAWGDEHLGTSATRYLLAPALQGIYAGIASQLSASLILAPLFKTREKNKGPRSVVSCRNGMQEIISKTYEACLRLGVRFYFNHAVTADQLQSDNWILCTSAPQASRLLRLRAPDLSQQLDAITMNTVISATVFFKSCNHTHQGFGVLIPKEYQTHTMGILFNGSIFAGRDQSYNETFILGDHLRENLCHKADSEILSILQNEYCRIHQTPTCPEIIEAAIWRWPQGLPNYDLQLESILKVISPPQGIYLHGNYLGGIGLSKILSRSYQLSQEINL